MTPYLSLGALHTLGSWRDEILNYFDYWITNGFVEEKNSRLKTIKRMAYGYCNWIISE